MTERQIGSLSVSPLGLGCMNMSSGYGPGDDAISNRLLNEALDAGYTFLDTATLYGGGHNETLIGSALRHRRNEYVLASKCALSQVDGKNHI
ncbi:MAG: aldo/keto reductase, partial [Arenicellales bacterium]